MDVWILVFVRGFCSEFPFFFCLMFCGDGLLLVFILFCFLFEIVHSSTNICCYSISSLFIFPGLYV